jgi:hypothetical protein
MLLASSVEREGEPRVMVTDGCVVIVESRDLNGPSIVGARSRSPPRDLGLVSRLRKGE